MFWEAGLKQAVVKRLSLNQRLKTYKGKGNKKGWGRGVGVGRMWELGNVIRGIGGCLPCFYQWESDRRNARP